MALFGGIKKVTDKINQMQAQSQPQTSAVSAVLPTWLNKTIAAASPDSLAQAKQNQAVTEGQKALNPSAPAYANIASPYAQPQAQAASRQANAATGADRASHKARGITGGVNPYATVQSYQPITSKFAGGAAYTQANAQKAGQVLQQLYTGQRDPNARAGESRIMGGLAAQGGAAFTADQEKALRTEADKAWAQTDPGAIADRLVAGMPAIKDGTDLNSLASSWVAPTVRDADMMERQARVNENIRTGQQGALAAEGTQSYRNQAFADDMADYARESAAAGVSQAKGNIEQQVEAARQFNAQAQQDAKSAASGAEVIGAVNDIEKQLGIAPSVKVTPQLASKIEADAIKREEEMRKEAEKLRKKYGQGNLSAKELAKRGYSIQAKQVAKAEQLSRSADALKSSAANLRQYNQNIREHQQALKPASNSLAQLESYYRRFA